MIVLGIDTSAYVNAVGVVNGECLLADFAFSAKTDSLTQIVANIDDVLKGWPIAG
jgi:tRNA A37 threonylcarbamoyladenosine modification protein TsaB